MANLIYRHTQIVTRCIMKIILVGKMAKLITNGTQQNQLIRRAFFGKSVKNRMRALLLLAKNETSNGGWLLETVLKFENVFKKN